MNSFDRIFKSINEAKKAKGKAMIPSHAEKKGGEKSKLGKANPYDHDHKVEEENGKKNKPKPKPKLTAAEREALVAKHGEQVGNAMADQRGLPKSMQNESSHKKKLIGKQTKLDKNKNGKLDAKDFKLLRGEAKEIITILGLIKEAYQDELISEEAFLAIADPIMRSLVEGRSVNFPDTYEMEDLDDAEEEEGTPKLSPKQIQIAKVAGNPKKIGADDLAALRKKGKKK